MAFEPAASSLLLRLTQARIGDTLHDGNGTVVTVVNAFTTVNPATEGIVRAVDYQVVGAPGQFRLFADDAGDVARWRRSPSRLESTVRRTVAVAPCPAPR